MAIVTYPLNGIDYDAENAETYLCTRTSGVYSADGHFQASVTGDRQVSISAGLAWIQNTDFAGKSVCNTEPVAVEVPIADGTRPRIDRIVLRFDKAANASSIVLKQGTPSSAPAAPTVERTELVYELGLCTVLVPASSTLVSIGDVTSTLLDETVCGIMRDGVTGIPTAQLQEQVNALIENLREVIEGVESGSEYMLGAVYDPDGMARNIFADIAYMYKATFAVSAWSGSGPYTQTATVTPVDGGQTVTATTQLCSGFGVDDTLPDASYRVQLSAVSTLGKSKNKTFGDGTMTVTVAEKPSADAEIYFMAKKGGA